MPARLQLRYLHLREVLRGNTRAHAKVALGRTAALEADCGGGEGEGRAADNILKVSTTTKTRAQLERFAKAIGEKTISKAANTLLEALRLKIYFTNKGLDP